MTNEEIFNELKGLIERHRDAIQILLELTNLIDNLNQRLEQLENDRQNH